MISSRHLALAAAFALPLAAHADGWTAPTPAELAMTSIPEVPNAPALYLYREQTTDDKLHMHSYYVRLKVLNERGKDEANVELPYWAGTGGYTAENISGRTIHPDGSIVPFSGKPYDKLIARAGSFQHKAKVFTLPSVEVGSILEYRYKIRFDDNYYMSPEWIIQSDLFVRKAHYQWLPTDRDLVNEKGDLVSGRIAWSPILPGTAAVKSTQLPNGKLDLELDIQNVPPAPDEEYMPPTRSLSYRVQFYYTAFPNVAAFWKSEGKSWSKSRDKFIGPNDAVRSFVNATVTPADTPTQKADKLYAALMTFENTDFTREHSTREEKAEGFKDVANSGDIVTRKRGTGDQLAETYVAMARAAGIKASLAAVSDRSEHFFIPMYLSLGQLDDYLAILNLDGKDVFYDPGQRFSEPAHLAWKHTMAGGIRQVEGGTETFTTPVESYNHSSVNRVADLTLDEQGTASGTVSLTFSGDAALEWRQRALRGDDTSIKSDLRTHLEQMLPGGSDVRVNQIDNLNDYAKPLKVTYQVSGPVASSTGKRLLVPADLFECNARPRFASPHRETAIDLHYSVQYRDAVRFKFPTALQIESVPAPAKETVEHMAAFQTYSSRTPNSVTSFRNVAIASPMFAAKDYADLKGFYGKLETRDQETLILTHAATAAATATATASTTVATIKPVAK